MTIENNQLECGIWDKEGGCLLPLELLEALPEYHRETIPEEYLDMMGPSLSVSVGLATRRLD